METTAGTGMIAAIGEALTSVLSWFGNVITALVTESGALYPLLGVFAIGIAISLVMIVVKVVRHFAWGA